ncbi:MAG: DUF1294 domain-containing protein [Lachnospiraceae bacterium]|nr:DUF1294 domain-containing protein [Lachnospiraceae bacterium]
MIYYILIAYLIIINVIGLAVMGIDKLKAMRGDKWRIPEKTLFFVALIGGSLGTTVGMYTFRHKTKHWYFTTFMPIIFVLQACLIAWLLKNLAN